MSLEFERQLNIVKAVMAHEIAERDSLAIAHPSLIEKEGIYETTCMTLLDCHVVGYPLGDELLPLAYMLNKLPRPEIDLEVGITHHDELMDDANAHLHDRLLNVVLPFDVESEIDFDAEPLNRAYENFIIHSAFAGGIASNSAEIEAAKHLLFPVDENDFPQESKIYKTYVKLSEEVQQLRLDVEMHRNAGDTVKKEIAESALRRKKAVFETIGQRKRVEDALDLISSVDMQAGFEDEREGFRNLFESRRRERISDGLSYHTAKIRPLEPLFEFETSSLWRKVALEEADISKLIDAKIKSYFGITDAEVKNFITLNPSIRFDYVSCDLSREWFSRQFLSARYWNNPEALSDGKGGGSIPTEPRKLIFIRDVSVTTAEGLELRVNPSAQAKVAMVESQVNKIDFSQKRASPLLKEIKTARMAPSVKAQFQKMQVSKLKVSEPLKIKAKGADRFKALNLEAKTIASRQPHKIQSHKKMKRHPQVNKIHQVPRKLQRRTVASPLIFKKLFPQKPIVVLPKPNQNKPSDRAAIINGKIQFQGEIDHRFLIVTLHEMEETSLRQTRLPLMNKGENEFWFSGQAFRSIKMTRGRKSAGRHKAIAFKIQISYHDQVVVDQYFEYSDKTETHNFDWLLKPALTEIQLADSQQPNLFAYGIRLLPKAPNPDPTLDWDEDFVI